MPPESVKRLKAAFIAYFYQTRKRPHFKVGRLRETLGESYFGYLSELEDLVVIMHESHRYRAKAGAQAINVLKPILGLELTATPRVETGGGREFENDLPIRPRGGPRCRLRQRARRRHLAEQIGVGDSGKLAEEINDFQP